MFFHIRLKEKGFVTLFISPNTSLGVDLRDQNKFKPQQTPSTLSRRALAVTTNVGSANNCDVFWSGVSTDVFQRKHKLVLFTFWLSHMLGCSEALARKISRCFCSTGIICRERRLYPPNFPMRKEVRASSCATRFSSTFLPPTSFFLSACQRASRDLSYFKPISIPSAVANVSGSALTGSWN